MLSIFGILFFLPHILALQSVDLYPKFSRLNLPPGPFGPDSVALDGFNQGPYASVSDGRILKYNGTDFVDFAYTSPNRTKQLCDGVTDINLGRTCGRVFGFCFDPLTGFLYIVGAYGGFYRVGPQGGQATLLATSTPDGVPFHFPNGIDFDQLRRVVYFTDASSVSNFTDVLQGKPPPPGDSTGRLLEYNTRTGQVKVLAQGLPRPAGPSVNSLSTFVLFSSFTTQKIFKYWLVGPKANTIEVVLDLPGTPIKIKRASTPETFWVAVNVVVQQQPRIVNAYGYQFYANGKILLIKNFTAQYPGVQVNIVQEYSNIFNGGELYVGSRVVTFVGKYTKR